MTADERKYFRHVESRPCAYFFGSEVGENWRRAHLAQRYTASKTRTKETMTTP
jgi:hypothetical protein